MKPITLLGTLTLLLIFGATTPAYAQEPHDQDHPTKPEEPKPADNPKNQAEPPKTPNDNARPQETKPPKEEPKPEKPKATPPSNQGERQQAEHQNDEHAKAQQDASHKQTAQAHGRIPDDKFKANFGREHTFHVGHPVIVGGRARFSYGGYSFFIGQAWPGAWGYDDDVYIVDVNGVYYLVDNNHPGIQLELVIG